MVRYELLDVRMGKAQPLDGWSVRLQVWMVQARNGPRIQAACGSVLRQKCLSFSHRRMLVRLQTVFYGGVEQMMSSWVTSGIAIVDRLQGYHCRVLRRCQLLYNRVRRNAERSRRWTPAIALLC